MPTGTGGVDEAVPGSDPLALAYDATVLSAYRTHQHDARSPPIRFVFNANHSRETPEAIRRVS